MNLLDKFATVEIKADNRISEADRLFCIQNQTAYEKAGEFLRKVMVELEAALEEQRQLLCKKESEFYESYMDHDHLTVRNVTNALVDRHKTLIQRIVSYFSHTYNVELECSDIQKHLIPSQPEHKPPYSRWGWDSLTKEQMEANRIYQETYEAELKSYHDTIYNLTLRYEDIIDEIFVHLGGFSFTEQALKELKEKCYNAAHHRDWRCDKDAEDFEVKKDVLQLSRYACHFDPGWSTPRWSIPESTRHILDAIAHFDRGEFGYGCKAFPSMFNWQIETNYFEFPWMDKVRSVKLFKNGRVDIKFASAAAVNEFVNGYLKGSAV